MTETLAWIFPAITLISLIGVPAYAGIRRGRFYALFSAIILGFSSAGALAVYWRLGLWIPGPLLPWVQVLFVYAMCATSVHYLMLSHARMRPPLYRWAISTPGQVFLAANFIATFWLIVLLVIRVPLYLLEAHQALAWLAPLDALPYVMGIMAALTSARPKKETVQLRIGEAKPTEFKRLPVRRSPERVSPLQNDSPLRIVQITDPHLGPWQPVQRLRELVASLAKQDPDLVLLTGDFLTMESNATPGALAEALSPLAELPGRCFAIFGNHDHEAPEEVRSGLAANGICLLVDEAESVVTRTGPIQIIGADYVGKNRKEHLQTLLEAHPRTNDQPRLLMLHDPSAFHDLPKDNVDLVLSGHTHGGQVGLVSLGFDWTVLSRSKWPDHGHFALGRSHLYVHRGTGFYGFPLRIGVPGEASILEVHWTPQT